MICINLMCVIGLSNTYQCYHLLDRRQRLYLCANQLRSGCLHWLHFQLNLMLLSDQSQCPTVQWKSYMQVWASAGVELPDWLDRSIIWLIWLILLISLQSCAQKLIKVKAHEYVNWPSDRNNFVNACIAKKLSSTNHQCT